MSFVNYITKFIGMKTKILLSILIVFFINSLTAQTNYQYFDGADTSKWNSTLIYIDEDSSNVWQIGKPQKAIFDSAATNPNAIITDTISFYPINNSSIFIAKVYPERSWGVFALQWKQKLDIDSNYDGGIIEFSSDYGNSWHNAFNNPYVYNFYGFQSQNQDTLVSGEYAFSGTDSVWRDIWLCFDWSWLSLNEDTVFFRFTLLSDSIDNNKEGWIIDNMISHTTFIHVGVNEVKQEKYLNVYPNPATDVIYIEAQKLQEFHIIENMTLSNSLGQVVEEWKNIPTKFFIDTRKYKSGLYHLKIKTNVKSETLPIVIHQN